MFRPIFITTLQTNLHEDFINHLKSIVVKQKSMIRVMEKCPNGGHNRSIICHENITYNYADIFTVSTYLYFFYLKKIALFILKIYFHTTYSGT